MVNFVKSFRKVKKDSINLFFFVEAVGEVIKSGDELRFATPPLSEAMLGIIKNVMFFEVVHNVAMNDVLKEFRRDRCKRDRAIVFSFAFIAFLECGDYVSPFPVRGDRALI